MRESMSSGIYSSSARPSEECAVKIRAAAIPPACRLSVGGSHYTRRSPLAPVRSQFTFLFPGSVPKLHHYQARRERRAKMPVG